jgi:hypothetical protein
MNKVDNKISQPDISINTNVVADMQKLFSENWSALLTKNEQTIVKVLHNEQSALNVYEIRRLLIFSTFTKALFDFIIQHDSATNKLKKEVKDATEKRTNKWFFEKDPPQEISGLYTYEIGMLIDQPTDALIVRLINDLKLSKYKDYPAFEFSSVNVRSLGKILRDTFEQYPFQISDKKQFPSNFDLKMDYITSNKTRSEDFIIKVLSSLNVEIFGFSTITTLLENLRKMKIVLKRDVNVGKSKTAYFINPMLIKK